MPSDRQRHVSPLVLIPLAVCWGLFTALPAASQAEVYVDDSSSQTNRPAAIASDLEPAPVDEIAREVLRLQEQMGGSLVRNRAGLQDWNNASVPVTPTKAPAYSPRIELGNRPHRARDQRVEKVSELRAAAWQLDTTAHRLEGLDLYDQADALRRVASRLRSDARAMKQAANSTVVGKLDG